MKSPVFWRSHNCHMKNKSELTKVKKVGNFPTPGKKKIHEKVRKTRKRSKEKRFGPIRMMCISDVWIWH